ncbi:MAG: hypothetical protein CMQ41_11910 [Gammaproteobacteria bacterium]|nr:hypothetical protein [Gammaproteobacteria bacterium]|tara:strand:- start:322 stop:1173 length:852 start_codon:yes stop_codon:yes gene_type:complete
MHIRVYQQFFCFWVLLCLAETARSQQIDLNQQTWSAEVIRPQGQAVIPLYDGWYPNDDGSKTICFGYFNMNTEETFDIPIGEDNYLDTDYPGLDLSNTNVPTHFDVLPVAYRHVFCAFTITVPESFNTSHRITWHISSNRYNLSTPGKVIPPYVLDEPTSNGRGDLAPLVRLSPDSESVRGRTGLHSDNPIEARVGEPVALQAWIEHPDEKVWVGWSHHSGAGKIDFDNKEYEILTSDGVANVLATFSQPGEYVVRMQTIDTIAAFEFYCCHTNAYFNINVSN